LRKFYFKQTSGFLYRTTYSIDSTNADILIFGSSRANHHYIPHVFEDSLKMTCYNTGRDGNFLLYNYALFKTITNRYTPKIVVFDISPNEFYYKSYEYDRLSILLPYYKNHPEIRNILYLRSPLEKYKLMSAIYPFNSNILSIAIGNTEINKKRNPDINGYVPLHGTLIDTILEKVKLSTLGLIDTNKINALNDIINTCNNNGILPVFIQSPLYQDFPPSNAYFSGIDSLAKTQNDIFWSWLDDPHFLSAPHLFKDKFHLNENGAMLFSKTVVRKLKLLINNVKIE